MQLDRQTNKKNSIVKCTKNERLIISQLFENFGWKIESKLMAVTHI